MEMRIVMVHTIFEEMKALIVDDEAKARNLLRVLLEENCPQIIEMQEAANVPEAVRLINRFHPDIVFLDIEMPGYSGIQLLDFFSPEQVTFEIVFTTAYSEYAIKAFDLNAVAYLLKPLSDDKVVQALAKAIENIGKSQVNRRLEELKKTLHSSKFNKIGLPLADGVLFVNLDEIVFFQADRMYTKVYTQNDEALLVSKPMKFFLNILSDNSAFYRPHRSFLINLNHIKRYSTQEGGFILMDNEQVVSISKENREEFQKIVQL